MHRRIACVSAAAAAGVAALSVLAVTGAAAAGAATGGPPQAMAPAWGTSGAPPVPGTQLWVRRYNGPGNGFDFAASVAVSQAGGKVFVTGASAGKASGSDYATVAYSAATGARLWANRYNGPANRSDSASSLAAGPGGATVFVTGQSNGGTSGGDYATVAYRASTGAQLWVARFNGPGNGNDAATSLAVSPGGGTVYVTGSSPGTTSRNDYATIAYNAVTGARLWVARYNGPGDSWDAATSLAASPDGSRVYVTGRSYGKTSGQDYATVAYNAATGIRLWVRRYNAPAGRA